MTQELMGPKIFFKGRGAKSNLGIEQKDIFLSYRCGGLAILWLLRPPRTLGTELQAEKVKQVSTIMMVVVVVVVMMNFWDNTPHQEGILGRQRWLGANDEATLHDWLHQGVPVKDTWSHDWIYWERINQSSVVLKTLTHLEWVLDLFCLWQQKNYLHLTVSLNRTYIVTLVIG